MMTFRIQDWHAVAERLEALPGLGAHLAAKLRKAGDSWKRHGKEPGLLAESDAYRSWVADAQAMIANVYQLAQQMDGQSIPEPGGAEYAIQYERAIRRLTAARSKSDNPAYTGLADVYLNEKKELPRQPRQYIDAFYEGPPQHEPWNRGHRRLPSYGELELALRQALDAAEQWLAMQGAPHP